MVGVSRLLTFADIDDPDDDGPNGRGMSVKARHEAVLADGRRVVLLDGRGWSGGAWAFETVEGLERTARDVVGPDEPLGGSSHAGMAAGHWETLAGILRDQDVEVDPAELSELRHDVELSPRLSERVSRVARDAS
jgi:hypothetical protein